MHRRIFAIAMATLLTVSTAGSSYAAPPAPFHHRRSTDQPPTGKMIRFSIRNDGGNAVVMKSGEQQYTIPAGKSLPMQLQEGAEIVAVSGTSQGPPGAVLTRVSAVLKGNTLVIS